MLRNNNEMLRNTRGSAETWCSLGQDVYCTHIDGKHMQKQKDKQWTVNHSTWTYICLVEICIPYRILKLWTKWPVTFLKSGLGPIFKNSLKTRDPFSNYFEKRVHFQIEFENIPQARAREARARARDPGPNGVFVQTQFDNCKLFSNTFETWIPNLCVFLAMDRFLDLSWIHISKFRYLIRVANHYAIRLVHMAWVVAQTCCSELGVAPHPIYCYFRCFVLPMLRKTVELTV